MRALLHDLPSLLIGLAAVLIVCVRLLYIPSNRRTARIDLLSLAFMGLAFRLWTAATTDRLYEIPVLLVGDEGHCSMAAFSNPLRLHRSTLCSFGPCYLMFGHSYPAVLYVHYEGETFPAGRRCL